MFYFGSTWRKRFNFHGLQVNVKCIISTIWIFTKLKCAKAQGRPRWTYLVPFRTWQTNTSQQVGASAILNISALLSTIQRFLHLQALRFMFSFLINFSIDVGFFWKPLASNQISQASLGGLETLPIIFYDHKVVFTPVTCPNIIMPLLSECSQNWTQALREKLGVELSVLYI